MRDHGSRVCAWTLELGITKGVREDQVNEFCRKLVDSTAKGYFSKRMRVYLMEGKDGRCLTVSIHEPTGKLRLNPTRWLLPKTCANFIRFLLGIFRQSFITCPVRVSLKYSEVEFGRCCGIYLAAG